MLSPFTDRDFPFHGAASRATAAGGSGRVRLRNGVVASGSAFRLDSCPLLSRYARDLLVNVWTKVGIEGEPFGEEFFPH